MVGMNAQHALELGARPGQGGRVGRGLGLAQAESERDAGPLLVGQGDEIVKASAGQGSDPPRVVRLRGAGALHERLRAGKGI